MLLLFVLLLRFRRVLSFEVRFFFFDLCCLERVCLLINVCTHTHTHKRANERCDEHATHAREHKKQRKTKEPAYLRRFNRVSSVFIRLLIFARRDMVSSPPSSKRAREQRESTHKRRREERIKKTQILLLTSGKKQLNPSNKSSWPLSNFFTRFTTSVVSYLCVCFLRAKRKRESFFFRGESSKKST